MGANTAIVIDRFPESDDFSLTIKDAPVKGAFEFTKLPGATIE